MRWPLAARIVPVALLGACGGSAGDGSDAAPSACRATASTPDDIAACVPDGPWLLQLSAAADRPISADVVAATDIDLRSEHIAPPEPCPDCLDHVRFRSSVDGVVLGDEAGDDYLVQARSAHIPAGTRFRVRVRSISEFPFYPVILPTVELVPSTDAPCAAGEQRCEVDQVCYGVARICYDCERRGGPACACVDDANEPLAEGAACEYAVSFDLLESGTCIDGVCTPGR